MTKISILGCGWLGLPLATHLLKSGYSVFGSSTSLEKEKKLVSSGIQAFTIDIANTETLTEQFFNVEELIIAIPPKAKNYSELLKNLIPKIEASTIKRVTYISSTSVYGEATGKITEKLPTNPVRESAKQILKVEQLLLNNHSFKTNIIRFGGLIGKNRHPAFYLSGKELKNSNDVINLIHLEDCIGVIHALLKSTCNQEIFNAVNPIHPTRGLYYSQVCKQLELPLPIVTDTKSIIKREISSKKIISVLNYDFKNNLILS